MGYIKLFGENLDSMLRRYNLTDDERTTVVSYVKDVVLATYKNGIEQGRLSRDTKTPAAYKKPTHRNTR